MSRKVQTFSHSMTAAFRSRLLAWYDANARDLPWRETRDPYRIWLSEIMLQQTRVAAVIAHYHEFLRRFPTVQKLANARQASVLAAWSGLGYYRRARMLHAAAKAIARERDGKFPETVEGLRKLPGIGRYTAAAIASIAFDEPVAVVDGNVERVLQRVSGQRLAGEDFWLAAETLLDRSRPGDSNQAMMELGATVCTPRAPSCLTCPVIDLCATRGEMATAAKPRQKKREIHYALHFRANDSGIGDSRTDDSRTEYSRDPKVFLVQRPRDARLMAGMWELPEMASPPPHPLSFRRLAKRARGTRFLPGPASDVQGAPPTPYLTLKHSITVTDYTVQVWRMPSPPHATGKWIPVQHLPRIALTGLTRKILRKAEIIAGHDRQV